MRVSAVDTQLYRATPSSAGFRDSGGDGELFGPRERLDHRAAETPLTVVGHGVLTGCDCTLRLIEYNVHGAVGPRLEPRRLVALAVAHLHGAAERLALRGREPVPGTGAELTSFEQRMIVTLHDDQRVASCILRGDIPRRLRTTAAATDVQPLALTERVEGESLVHAEMLAVGRFDRPRVFRDIACEKLAKRPLTNEADTGAVGLVEHGESGSARELAYLVLVELAERHERGGELGSGNRVQEITLVLGAVTGLAQRRPVGRCFQARIMAGREVRGTEPPRPLEGHPEFDLTVTEYIGVRRAARAMLAEEMGEHALAILGCEADSVQDDAELAGYRAGVLEVPRRGAVGVVILFLPIAEEESLYVPAGLLQEKRCDGRIHTAGEADDDACRDAWRCGRRRHAHIVMRLPECGGYR